jgi:hypothetical protein
MHTPLDISFYCPVLNHLADIVAPCVILLVHLAPATSNMHCITHLIISLRHFCLLSYRACFLVLRSASQQQPLRIFDASLLSFDWTCKTRPAFAITSTHSVRLG